LGSYLEKSDIFHFWVVIWITRNITKKAYFQITRNITKKAYFQITRNITKKGIFPDN